MSRRRVTILVGFMLMTVFSARPSQSQQCPVVEVNCSERAAGGDSSIRCVAGVNGSYDGALSYQWSVSVVAPIKNHGGSPDQVEIDLSDFPLQEVKVSVNVTGLPTDCANTATFESHVPDDGDADSPQPTSALTPTIIASCPQEVVEGAPLSFSAQASNAGANVKTAWRWTVERGQIKSGQGTPLILVDTTDLGNQIVRATVTIDGVDGVTPVTCATQIKALPKSYRLDEYDDSVSLEEKAARLSKLSLRLKAELDERAYIVAYSRRGRPREEMIKEANGARRFLVDERGVEPARVVVVDGGFRKAASVELWIAQNGAPPPPTQNSILTETTGRQ